MPISVTCPKCGTRARAPEKAAGRLLACPKCRGNVPVPRTTDAIATAKGLSPAARLPAPSAVVVAAPPAAQPQTDVGGVVGLVFGILVVPAGVFTACFWPAYPFVAGLAVLGTLASLCGRGNLRVAGLTLNLLVLVPAIALGVALVFGASAAAVLSAVGGRPP